MPLFNITIHSRSFTEQDFRELTQYLPSYLNEMAIEIVSFFEEWFLEKDFIEIKTSGSTGNPKTIQLKKSAMLASAKKTCQFFNLNHSHSTLLCLPVKYIAGKMMLVRALVSGMDLNIAKPSANPFEKLDKTIDFTAITPHQLSQSLETLKNKNIKNIIVGGAPFSMPLQLQVQKLPIQFFETYGMTETCSHIALRKVNGTGAQETFETLEGITINTDQRQCLTIKAPELSKELLITNDIVETVDKNHFKWLGRFDNVINSGGIKIFPEQVEKKLSGLIQQHFFITSQPDDILGEKVVLVIEGITFSKIELNQLKEKIAAQLDNFEYPKVIIFKNKFEYTESGKFKRVL